MGFYSQVQITAEPKALEMFKAAIGKYDWSYSLNESEEHGVITFDWVKWYTGFKEVQDVEEVRKLLNTDDYNDTDGYGYKIMVLNEDDTHDEYSNDKGDARFYDVCVQCYIDNPCNA